MKVKKGDNVIVLTGKDKGQSGKVLRALPREDKVLIEGINIKKVHKKAKKQGGKGEIIEKSFPIHVSNVKLSVESKASPKKLAPKT
ncbi:MAG: 50S ribosomal protein L24 [bacterium]|nr:50S ribosomal protein L24 [bacterium]